MKNKTLAITTMVSMLALTACGGGGGGGSVNISAPTPINIGTVSFDTLATDNFAQLSVLRDVTADGKMTATEAVKVFKWMNNNANLDTSEFSKYQVTVDGQTMTLDTAWNKLKGYKKVFYDGKEDFWQGIVDSGKFDDEHTEYLDVKAFAENENKIDFVAVGKGDKTVDDVKKDIVPIVEEEKEEDKKEDKKEETPDVPEESTEVSRTKVKSELVSQKVISKEATDVSKSIHDVVDCVDQTLTDGSTFTGKCTKYRVQTNYSETVEKTFDVTYHVTMSDNTLKVINTTETETVVVPVSPTITYEYVKNGDTPVEDNTEEENNNEENTEEENIDDTNNGDTVNYKTVEYTNSDLGTVTPGAIKDANLYRTEEFMALANHEADNLLSAIKADAAWSRGWTGKGSIVIIADSGTNINHTDLDNQIHSAKNFIDVQQM